MAKEDTMKKKNGVDKRGKAITEIETLQELIDREGASVRILLSVAAGEDRLEEDDVVMTMRDSFDRVEKMKESLERLEQIVR
jgi:hypothetical protein